MAYETINTFQFLPKKGDVMTVVKYDGKNYLKTTAQEGTITDYYLPSAPTTPVTLDGTPTSSILAFDMAVPLVVDSKPALIDNLGNAYNQAWGDEYLIETEEGEVPKLVGRAPGGRFGGRQ